MKVLAIFFFKIVLLKNLLKISDYSKNSVRIQEKPQSVFTEYFFNFKIFNTFLL